MYQITMMMSGCHSPELAACVPKKIDTTPCHPPIPPVFRAALLEHSVKLRRIVECCESLGRGGCCRARDAVDIHYRWNLRTDRIRYWYNCVDQGQDTLQKCNLGSYNPQIHNRWDRNLQGNNPQERN